jgi:hypothetical protein
MMTIALFDIIQETTNSTGTGDMTLAGAVGSYLPFGMFLTDGQQFPYTITDNASEREVGTGTYHAISNSFSRTTVLSSTNGGAAVPWGTGAKNVFMDLQAEMFGGTSGYVLTANGPNTVPTYQAPGAAAAGSLTGTTLASNVLNSSLTSVGTLGNLTVTNPIAGSITGSSGSCTGNAATATLAATATVANAVAGTGVTGGSSGQLLLAQSGTSSAFETMSQDGTITNAGVLTVVSAGGGTGNFACGNVNMPSAGQIVWNSDTGLSRISAGTIGVGDGTQGDYSGVLLAATLSATNGVFGGWLTVSGSNFCSITTNGGYGMELSASGNLTLNSSASINTSAGSASTWAFAANANNSVRFTDGTNSYHTIDTRTGHSGSSAHTFANTAPSFASASSNAYSLVSLSSYTLTQTGTTTVTALNGLSLLVNSPKVSNSSTSALTVTTVSAVQINGPLATNPGGGSLTPTNSIALDIPTYVSNGGGGNPNNAAGLRVAAPSGGTNNYSIGGVAGSVFSLATMPQTAGTATVAGLGLTITADAAITVARMLLEEP